MEGDVDCEEFKENLESFLGYLEGIGSVTDADGSPLDNMNWTRRLVVTPYDKSLSRKQIRDEIGAASRIYDVHNFKFRIKSPSL